MRDHALHRGGSERQLQVGVDSSRRAMGHALLLQRPVLMMLHLATECWQCVEDVALPVLLRCSARREEIVHVLQSSTPEEMEENVERLSQWARSWRPSS